MEPNESTQGRSGEQIPFSGDYRAACCNVVVKLAAGQLFPNCKEHGETGWSWIPPFVQSGYGTDAIIDRWKRLRSRTISDTVVIPSTGAVAITSFEALAQ